MAGCKNTVEDYMLGTKGRAEVLRNYIQGPGEPWKYGGPKSSMYDVEHKELFEAIRAGRTINNGTYMSYSTLLAIMGRMACYTGQEIAWDMALNSKEDLSPAKYEWGDVKIPEVAMPGVTKFV
jgi:hypothetical protein